MIKSINKIEMVIFLILVYVSSLYNYLLFHTIAEIFSICIAFTVFILAVSSIPYIKNSFLILIGVAYLFIGFLDLLHTISYKGMQIFTDYDYYANQLWIATRYLESITLLIAFIIINTKRKINFAWLFNIYLAITTLIILSVFIWKIFPICFIDGVGLTPFKKISEYIICMILILGIVFLNKKRTYFNNRIYRWLLLSMIFTIISELSFTVYIDNYGFSNLIGHYFKIFSFYMIFKAVIETGVREPYELVFKELKENEKKLYDQNLQLDKKANTDELTGLNNHRYLYESLEKLCNIHERDISVILLDIDFFKNVNDTYGHLTGDIILHDISKLIQEEIREQDIVGRYGGEEFLVILPDTEKNEALRIAERVRTAIEKHVFTSNIKITVSGGIAQYKGGKISDFIQRADDCLYNAKNNGRNRVMV